MLFRSGWCAKNRGQQALSTVSFFVMLLCSITAWFADQLSALIPGIVIAFIAARLTVMSAIKRFHEERWWDQKHQTYVRLLEALHHLKQYASEKYDEQLNPNELSKERATELHAQWRQFRSELNKLHDLASFQLSEEAVAILEDYRKAQAEGIDHQDFFRWIESDLVAATDCLAKLKQAAKRDLKVR